MGDTNSMANNENVLACRGKKLLYFTVTVLIICSGFFAFFLRAWNNSQIDTILLWAAEKEGAALYNEIIRDGSTTSSLISENPKKFIQIAGSHERIVAAGLFRGQQLIASYSIEGFDKQKILDKTLKNLEQLSFTVVLEPELSLYYRSFGAGRGPSFERGFRRQQLDGDSFRGGRIQQDENKVRPRDVRQRSSIYLLFAGPDSDVVKPLYWQKNLWPVLWLAISVFWLVILAMQQKKYRLEVLLENESHLSDIGRMSGRLAHEIKNPLGAIRGMAQILTKKVADNKAACEMAKSIEKETFRLEELTKGILDFSKPFEYKPETINLKTLVDESVELFCQQLESGNIKKSFSDDVFCEADENALKQIMINLLKNAFEADESLSKTEVTITEENGFAVVSIYNSGGPLSDAVLENAFKPFYSEKVRGYGLGLSLSRRLAQLQGGKLELKNSSENRVVAKLYLQRVKKDETKI